MRQTALGIKSGIAVIASGHDTQFAILGSGAGVNQPVLSSGTWEILMIRALSESLQIPSRNSGVTIELDSQPGLVNIGVQWVASGVLEWVSRLFYPDLTRNSRYSTMIREAETIPAGSDGITMIPELFSGGFSGKQSQINGFTHETTRAHIYRAALGSIILLYMLRTRKASTSRKLPGERVDLRWWWIKEFALEPDTCRCVGHPGKGTRYKGNHCNGCCDDGI